ncbi:MAG: phosphodiester glycosidase family protein, partial [Bacteroidales bacterium]|nr:phosphodiester glycosidase family protein [Bacteroidales bacterium]
VSEDRITTGVYYTNYELWETTSGNIYGSSRPRSAIGYDSASGEIYLVAVTSNITLTRMALIMKGLGCDYAMNLDGGGSTQMYVSGMGELTNNNRDVKSTIGFFQKP